MTRLTYAEQLKHPKWQEKRLRVFEAAGFQCVKCGARHLQLHAHHKVYLRGKFPWEYADDLLECLCESCHTLAHAYREELDLAIGRLPTAALPALTEVASTAPGIGAADPKLLRAVTAFNAALMTDDPRQLVDARNSLQDVVDEMIDYRRGPGGAH